MPTSTSRRRALPTRPANDVFTKSPDIVFVPEQQYQEKQPGKDSRKRTAPQDEHEDAPPARREVSPGVGVSYLSLFVCTAKQLLIEKKDEVSALSASGADKDAQLTTLTSAYNTLNDKHSKAEKEWGEKWSRAEEEVKVLKQKCADQAAALEAAHTREQENCATQPAQAQQNSALHSQVGELQNQFREELERQSGLRQQSDQARHDEMLASKNREIQMLRQQFAEWQEEKSQQQQKAQRTYDSTIDDLSKAKAALVEVHLAHKAVQNKLSAVEDAHYKAKKALQDELATAKSRLGSVQNERDAAQTEAQQLRIASQSHLVAADSDREEARSRHEADQAEIEDLRSYIETIEASHAEELEKEKDATEAAEDDLVKERDVREAVEDELADLQKEIQKRGSDFPFDIMDEDAMVDEDDDYDGLGNSNGPEHDEAIAIFKDPTAQWFELEPYFDHLLLSEDGQDLVFVSRRQDHITKVVLGVHDYTDSVQNKILNWDCWLTKALDKGKKDLKYNKEGFTLACVYACLPETQVKAAQHILEHVDTAAGDFDMDEITLGRYTKQFLEKMREVNPHLSKLMDGEDPTLYHDKIDKERFVDAYELLASTKPFAQTVFDIGRKQLPIPAPGLGIWPAQYINDNAKRSIKPWEPVVERRALFKILKSRKEKQEAMYEQAIRNNVRKLGMDQQPHQESIVDAEALLETKRNPRCVLPLARSSLSNTKSPMCVQKAKQSKKSKTHGRKSGGMDDMFGIATPPDSPPTSDDSSLEPSNCAQQ